VSHPLRWDPELTKVRSGESIIRDPLRSALAVAAIVLAVGAFLPWAEGLIGYLPKHFGGFDGISDGSILFVLAAILVVIALDHDFVRARDGARRWTTMIIGLICLGDVAIGRQLADFEIAHWVDQGGHGALAPGFFIAGAGALGVALIGSYASLHRREGETGGPASLFRRPRRTDAKPLATTIGALAGLALAVAAAVSLFPPVTIGGVIIFFAGFGVVIGAYLGKAIGQRLA
jgi:hypothetical protein